MCVFVCVCVGGGGGVIDDDSHLKITGPWITFLKNSLS